MNVFETGVWKDFMHVECQWKEDYERIYQFIAFDNFISGEYVGNQYTIRKINIDHIQIEDSAASKATNQYTIYSYKKGQFLALMDQFKREDL
jgi:hypothetical protein